MATDKKRVTIYLHDSEKQKLDNIAADLGCSVSRLCGDVLLNSLPHLKIMAQAMKVARTNPQQAVELMKQAAETAQGDLLKTMENI